MLRFPVPFSHWDPELDRLKSAGRRSGSVSSGWLPVVDLYEMDDQYVVTAELPGTSREDIRLQIQNGTLVMSGERPESSPGAAQVHRMERSRGKFSRKLELPLPIDVERVTAEFKAGVVTVRIPKIAPRQHRVEVR
jgi:HSP20 family protein